MVRAQNMMLRVLTAGQGAERVAEAQRSQNREAPEQPTKVSREAARRMLREPEREPVAEAREQSAQTRTVFIMLFRVERAALE